MNFLSTLIALALCVSAVNLSAQNRFQYSEGEADTVLIELNAALQSYHPFAYRANGNERLDSVLAVTRTELPELIKDDSIHVADLIELAATFNEVIGDGHLQLTRKRDKSFNRLNKLFSYDFHTRYTEDGRIVLSDTLVLLDSTTFNPGTEVLSFQGERPAKIYSRLGAFMGINDHDRASAKTFYPALNPGTFYQRLYGWKDSLNLELKTDRQRHKVLLLPSARMAYLNRDTTKPPVPKKVEKLNRKAKKRKRIASMERLINLDTTSHPDIYVLRVRSFSSRNFKRVNEYRHSRDLMKRLDSLRAKGLIIDLRHNTGGSLNFVNHIYSMVADVDFYSGDGGMGYSERAQGKNIFDKVGSVIFSGVRKKDGAFVKKTLVERNKPDWGKEHFNGEVVALVNQTTFSGGTCLANYVKTYKRGKVVGQIPGGSAERMFAGTLFKEAIGPEKSLLINMPLWYMDMPGDFEGNLIPDIIVPITAEAIAAQRDDTIEAAVKSFYFVEN